MAFSESFLQSYKMFKDKADKNKAEKAQQGLAGLLAEGDTNGQLVSNPTAELPANSNYLSNGTNYANRYDYKPVSQNSLTSLISQDNNPLKYTETPKAEPSEMSGDRINQLIAKGLKMGLDYGTASKMVGDYATRQDADYQKKVGNDALDLVMNAKTPADQKKAFIIYAQKTGKMDANTLKGLISTDTVKYDDGANINFYRTDSFGNPVDVGEDGKPVAYYSIAKQMSPEAQDASIRGNRALDISQQNADTSAARAYSKGGGGGSSGASADNKALTNAKYVLVKHEDWINKHTNKLTGELPNEQQSPYYKYLQSANDTLDGYYGIGGEAEEPANSGGGDDVVTKIQQAKAAGYSDDEIASFLKVSVDEVTKITGGSKPAESSSSFDFSPPTFGDENQTLLDYLQSGNAWTDFTNRNKNL